MISDDSQATRNLVAGSPAPWLRRLGPVVTVLVLVALTLIAFAPALDNGFLNWDDDDNFLLNQHFRGLGWAQVAWAWTTFHMGAYQPLGWMLLSAESRAWGLDPRGYHAVGVLFHAANTAALFALTLALLRHVGIDRGEGRNACAALAVALWAVHPLRVEAVAWVSSQTYLPCALFSILAVLAYLRACDQGSGSRPRARWMIASWGLFLASLLCKAPAVALPAVLVILDIYPLNRLGGGPGRWLGPAARRVWREKVPFFGLSLVFLVLAYFAKALTQVPPLGKTPDLLTRLGMFCYGVWFYLLKTVVPRDLTAYYALSGPWDWTRPRFLASVLGLLGVSAALLLARRRWPWALAVWAAFLMFLALSPVLVGMSPQFAFAADRYTYFAEMPIVPLLAAGFVRIASRRPPRAVIAWTAAGLAVVTGLTVLTRSQVRTWKDPESLWTHAIAHGAGHRMAPYVSLGTFYRAQGRTDQAIATYRAAVRVPLDPTDLKSRIFVHLQLGSLLDQKGDTADAAAQIAEGEYLYGHVLADQGREREAVRYFESAVHFNSSHKKARAELDAVTRGARSRRSGPFPLRPGARGPE
jgi:protein O-mannosyl-transferase